MLKKISAFLLTVLMLSQFGFPIDANAAEGIEFFRSSAGNRLYNGGMFAAVSSSLDVQNNSTKKSSFTVAENSIISPSLSSTDNEEKIYKIIEDPDTGERLVLYTPELPESDPADDLEDFPATDIPSMDYSIGAVRSVYDYYIRDTVDMRCLYVGRYCTVWGSDSDPLNIQITPQIAEQMGETFDLYFAQMLQAFSDRWYDVDGDGKVAIFCYDIEETYLTGSNRIGGYFWTSDFTNQNKADCIHIDSFPLMGSSGYELTRFERCYGTLVHELQHLLNASYEKFDQSLTHSESYINEAFSMAAEHLIFGERECLDRINTFNKGECSSYGLTSWYGNLNSYANSYLFGQYLRTRYGQQTGTNGNTFFKKFLTSRTSAYNSNSLKLAADILHTTPDQLILDFWAAIIRKDETGKYGFQGESWANQLQPMLSSLTEAGGTGGIGPSGARFYSLEDVGSCTVTSSNELNFISFPHFEQFALTTAVAANGKFELRDAEGAVITKATKGTNVYICTTPASGYKPYAIYVDGKKIHGSSFRVTGNHTVSVIFRKFVYSRVWGPTWTLFDNGTLRIYRESSDGGQVYFDKANQYDWAQKWSQYADRVKVISVENEVSGFQENSLSYFPYVTDLLLPSLHKVYSNVTHLSKNILHPDVQLVNVFFDGAETDWNRLSGDKNQFGDKVHFGLPVAVTVEGLKDAYVIGSNIGSAAGYGVDADGNKYKLGVVPNYNFTRIGEAEVTLEFCGYSFSRTVEVVERHRADISYENGILAIQLFKNTAEDAAKNAIIAVYCGEKMVAHRVAAGFVNGHRMEIPLALSSDHVVKVFWLTDTFSPTDAPTEKILQEHTP